MTTTNHTSQFIRHACRTAGVVLITLVAFGLLAATGAAKVRARQTFHVPFEFIVGDTTCPPGTYTVKKSLEGVMSIATSDNSTSVLFLAQSESSDKTYDVAELVFNRYGDVRFLDQIRPPDETRVFQLHRSPEQEAVAQRWVRRQETVVAMAKER